MCFKIIVESVTDIGHVKALAMKICEFLHLKSAFLGTDFSKTYTSQEHVFRMLDIINDDL